MRVGTFRRVQRRAAGLIATTLFAFARPAGTAAQSAAPPTPLSEVERVVHLLSRATYGPRPQDVQAALSIGAQAWLDRQLDPGGVWVRPFVAALPPHQQRTPPGSTDPAPEASSESILAELMRRAAVMMESGGNPVPVAQATLKLQRALSSERQLEEVMTDFWFNHFSVWYGKAQVRAAIVEYEAVAIRPYVFRRFEDMLIETARHPAMLMYLDNYLSRVAPDGVDGVGGINENYARELLELHTLGVEGGYTQHDVIDVARAFTGWTVPMRPGVRGRPPQVDTGARIPFEFVLAWHDRGEKVVLGQTLPAGRGMEDGLDVLRLLARHPSTARHVASKLVRHFVSDEPVPDLEDELANVFLETGGDLRAVTRALFTAEAFYDRTRFQAKAKRPFEYVVSALRAAGGDVELRDPTLRQQRTGIVERLRTLRHVPYTALEPTGFPSSSEEWVSAGAMVERMNFAFDLAAGRVDGVSVDPWSVLDPETAAALRGSGVAGNTELHSRVAAAVLAGVFPGFQPEGLQGLLVESLSGAAGAEPSLLVTRALALALGSPHFQRH